MSVNAVRQALRAFVLAGADADDDVSYAKHRLEDIKQDYEDSKKDLQAQLKALEKEHKDEIKEAEKELDQALNHLVGEAAGHYTNARNCFKALPDEVVLDLGARDFQMSNPNACMCGWVVRLGLARIANHESVQPEAIKPDSALPFAELSDIPEDIESKLHGLMNGDVPDTCENVFPAKHNASWSRVYCGVTESEEAPYIEMAFVDRFNEAVARA